MKVMYSIAIGLCGALVIGGVVPIVAFATEGKVITFSNTEDGELRVIDEQGNEEVVDGDSNERISYAPNWTKDPPLQWSDSSEAPKPDNGVFPDPKERREQQRYIDAQLRERRGAYYWATEKPPPKKRK